MGWGRLAGGSHCKGLYVVMIFVCIYIYTYQLHGTICFLSFQLHDRHETSGMHNCVDIWDMRPQTRCIVPTMGETRNHKAWRSPTSWQTWDSWDCTTASTSGTCGSRRRCVVPAMGGNRNHKPWHCPNSMRQHSSHTRWDTSMLTGSLITLATAIDHSSVPCLLPSGDA